MMQSLLKWLKIKAKYQLEKKWGPPPETVRKVHAWNSQGMIATVCNNENNISFFNGN